MNLLYIFRRPPIIMWRLLELRMGNMWWRDHRGMTLLLESNQAGWEKGDMIHDSKTEVAFRLSNKGSERQQCYPAACITKEQGILSSKLCRDLYYNKLSHNLLLVILSLLPAIWLSWQNFFLEAREGSLVQILASFKQKINRYLLRLWPYFISHLPLLFIHQSSITPAVPEEEVHQ